MPPFYNILAISGSLRAQSSNTELLRAAALVAPPAVTVTVLGGLATLPHFNPDLDAEGAIVPASVQAFRAEIACADALLICSPEYAHGVPGVLKNALDWLVSGHESRASTRSTRERARGDLYRLRSVSPFDLS